MDKKLNADIGKFIKKYAPETSYTIRKMILNSQPRSNGEVKIYVEVVKYDSYTGRHSKQTRRISTEVWIDPKYWSNKGNGKVSRKDPKHDEKNAMIDEVYIAVSDYINSRQPSKFHFKYPYEILQNVEKIRIHLDKLQELFPARQTNKVKGVVDYFDDYIKFRKDRDTPRGTLKEFTTVKNRIAKFDEFQKKKSYMNELDLVWSDSFETFLLKKVKNGDKKGYSTGTIEKTYTVLITVLYHFQNRKDTLKIRMYDDFTNKNFKRGEKSKNEANPLNQDQFKALYEHHFKEEHLELTKKRFCIQCTTGLRYGDMSRIKPDMIEGGVLRIIPRKSLHYKKPKPAIIPLNKYASELLAEYNCDTECLKIENQPYNRNLVEIFKIMRKEYKSLKFKNYTTHDARDTFISLAVTKGVDFKTILEWTAQSSYEIMDRYIKTTDEHKKQKMEETWDF